MSYKVLARKWRPQHFRDMLGQEPVLRALINALDTGRLHHAYLFTGMRGVGKTTIARIFAKCLNCTTNGVSSSPCGECAACRDIEAGRFLDLIEVDAASRTKVDETRELLENVPYAPAGGRYKVYLIDEVHMFSTHSFNALLKTLEEPPEHVKFLLATTDPQKVPLTVLSRCLQFNLRRMPTGRLADYLAGLLEVEEIAHERAALELVARAAGGSVRDALSLVEQAAAFGEGSVRVAEVESMLGRVSATRLVELLEALGDGELGTLFARVDALGEYAPDFAELLGELLSLLHRVALVQSVPDAGGDDGEDAVAGRVAALAAALAPDAVQLWYQIGLHARRDLPFAPDAREAFDMALLRMHAFAPDDGTRDGVPVAAAERAGVSGGEAPAGEVPGRAAAPSAPAPTRERAPGASGSDPPGADGVDAGAVGSGTGGSGHAGTDPSGHGADRAGSTARPEPSRPGANTGAPRAIRIDATAPEVSRNDVADTDRTPPPALGSDASAEPGAGAGARDAAADAARAAALAGLRGAVPPAAAPPAAATVAPPGAEEAAAASDRRVSLAAPGRAPAPPVATPSARAPGSAGDAARAAIVGAAAAAIAVPEERPAAADEADRAALSAEGWAETVAAMGLSGMPRQLANHCAFVAWDGARLALALERGGEHMNSPRFAERLRAALVAHVGHELALDVRLVDAAGEGGTLETPARLDAAREASALEEARRALDEDPLVQALVAGVDGSIDPDSVRPLESPAGHDVGERAGETS